MADAFRFIDPATPSSRRLLMCGEVEAGAVFPPVGNNPGRHPWVWRFWLGGGIALAAREGRATSDEKAKAALLAALDDWLRKAGLKVLDG